MATDRRLIEQFLTESADVLRRASTPENGEEPTRLRLLGAIEEVASAAEYLEIDAFEALLNTARDLAGDIQGLRQCSTVALEALVEYQTTGKVSVRPQFVAAAHPGNETAVVFNSSDARDVQSKIENDAPHQAESDDSQPVEPTRTEENEADGLRVWTTDAPDVASEEPAAESSAPHLTIVPAIVAPPVVTDLDEEVLLDPPDSPVWQQRVPLGQDDIDAALAEVKPTDGPVPTVAHEIVPPPVVQELDAEIEMDPPDAPVWTQAKPHGQADVDAALAEVSHAEPVVVVSETETTEEPEVEMEPEEAPVWIEAAPRSQTAVDQTVMDAMEEVTAVEANELASIEEPEVELEPEESAVWTEAAPRSQTAVDQTIMDALDEVTQATSEPAALPAPVEPAAEPTAGLGEDDVLAALGLLDGPPAAAATTDAPAIGGAPPSEAVFDVNAFMSDLDSLIAPGETLAVETPVVEPATEAPAVDATVDVVGETQSELPAEPTVEAKVDVAIEAAVEAAFEPPVESPVDAPTEIASDAPYDPTQDPSLQNPVEEEGEFWGSRPLNLPQNIMENLVFVVGDLKEQSEKFASVLKDLTEIELRETACGQLAEVASAIRAPAEEYKLKILDVFADMMVSVAERVGILSEPVVAEVLVRLRGIHFLLTQLIGGLEVAFESSWPTITLKNRLHRLLEDRQLHRSIVGWHKGDPERLLELDKVMEGIEPPPAAPDEGPDGVEIAGGSAGAPDTSAPAAEASTEVAAPGAPDAKKTEQIVRIELSRIEELLGVVSQLVMCKNQICAMLKTGGKAEQGRDVGQSRSASIEIDRLTARLQAGLLQARTMPLSRLFDRFPRMVRDIGRMKDKDIELALVGQETQVDKRVMDLLADPLAHLLKLRAGDGIESTGERSRLGKTPTGQMKLEADNQDSHVLIRIWDDGLELKRDAIEQTLIERKIVTAEHAQLMDDADLMALILHPDYPSSGSATVQANLDQLNAQVRLTSHAGKGTTFEIFFPLNVGIMSAMMARVDGEVYAIPQKTVMEVARLKPDQQFPVCKTPSMFLRDQVISLVDLTSVLHGKPGADTERVAIVVHVGDQRAGLLVDEVLGQQQVVIKELDAGCNKSDLFSGATLREDGHVSLILNVIKLLRSHAPRAVATQAA